MRYRSTLGGEWQKTTLGDGRVGWRKMSQVSNVTPDQPVEQPLVIVKESGKIGVLTVPPGRGHKAGIGRGKNMVQVQLLNGEILTIHETAIDVLPQEITSEVVNSKFGQLLLDVYNAIQKMLRSNTNVEEIGNVRVKKLHNNSLTGNVAFKLETLNRLHNTILNFGSLVEGAEHFLSDIWPPLIRQLKLNDTYKDFL